MARGLIGAALAGGAQAVGEIASASLQEKRQRALKRLEQEMAFERQDRQWQRDDTTWQRDAERKDALLGQQRGWQVEDRDLSHERGWEMERYRQGRQDTRRGSWQLVAADDGTLYQYNADTNESRPANLPEGVNPLASAGGKLTDRQKERIKYLQVLVKQSREAMSDTMVSEEDRDHYARQAALASAEIDSLTALGGGSLADRIASRLPPDGDGTAASNQVSEPQDIIGSAQASNEQRQANRQQADRRREIDDELTAIERDMTPRAAGSNSFLPGGIPGQDKALSAEQAEAYLQRIRELEDEMTPRQKATATRLAENLLRVE